MHGRWVVLGVTAVVWSRPLALLVVGAVLAVLAVPLTSSPTALLLALLVPTALYGVAYIRWQPRPALVPVDALRLVLPVLLAGGALLVLAFVPPAGTEPNPFEAFFGATSAGGQEPAPEDFMKALSSAPLACTGIPKCGRAATSLQVGIAGLLILLGAAAGWLLPRAAAAAPAAAAPAATVPEEAEAPSGQDRDPPSDG